MNKSKLSKLALVVAVLGGGAAVAPSYAADQAGQGIVHSKKDADTYNASADKSTVAPNDAESSDAMASESTLSESPREAATYSTEAYDDSARVSESSTAGQSDSSASSSGDAPYQVNFAFDSAELSDESQDALDELAEQLKDEQRPITIAISGHTDDSGPEAYNKDLAERRAKAVQDYLKDKDLKVSDWEVQAAGQEQPVASNETREGRQENRRVEINFSAAERAVSAVTE